MELTPAQKFWFVLNIRRDKEEHAELLKTLCMHIRPEAYFQNDQKVVSTSFADDIEQQLGRKLDADEKAELGIIDVEDDLDTIERM